MNSPRTVLVFAFLAGTALAACGTTPTTSTPGDDIATAPDGVTGSDGAQDATAVDAAGDAVADLIADAADLSDGMAIDATVQDTDTAPDVPPTDVAPATGAVTIKVVDAAGQAIAAAKVTLAGTELTVDAAGLAAFAGVAVGPAVATIQAAGYAPAARAVTVDSAKPVALVVALSAVTFTQVLLPDTATAVASPSVEIALPAAAFVLADGTPVTGPVDVAIAPIDPSQQSLDNAPGALVGIPTGGTTPQQLNALFVAEVSFTQAGKPLSLAPGKTATLTFKLPAAVAGQVAVGQKLGAWWYDLKTATWQQDGLGTIGVDAGGGKTFTATVSHFTWWTAASPISGSGCLKVTVSQDGQPLAGLQLLAQGVTYASTSQATTGADGSACLEVMPSATVQVSPVNAVLVGGPQVVQTNATVLACSVGASGCQPIAVTVTAACVTNAALCDDSVLCTTDSCDPTTGCAHVNNTVACNDGNACTQSDACLGGLCVGANPVVCTAADQCHGVGVCNTTNGACSSPNATDGTTCDDSNACTVTDTVPWARAAAAGPIHAMTASLARRTRAIR